MNENQLIVYYKKISDLNLLEISLLVTKINKIQKFLPKMFAGFRKMPTFATAIERESNKIKNILVR